MRLAAWRSGSGRGLFLVMALGVFVAAILLASAPIYARSMADLGLTYTIRNDLADHAGTRVTFQRVPLQTAEGQQLRQAVQTRIDQRLGWFTASQAQLVKTGWFPMGAPGEASNKGAPLGQPQSLTGYEQHVQVVKGRLPKSTGKDGPLEVAMSTRAASVAGLEPGAQLVLLESFDNCEREIPRELFPPPPPPCPITTTASFAISAVLVGIVEPSDRKDPFWLDGVDSYFQPQSVRIEDAGPVLPLFVDQQALMQDLGSRLPALTATFSWDVLADPGRLSRSNYQRARSDLVGLFDELAPVGGLAYSPLRDTLSGFGRSASYQQVPLTILLLEISGIAIFYVAIVAAIVVERQANEIALLRGRGSSLPQILGLYAMQGLTIGIPALLAAPFAAAGITALLGLTPSFRDASGGDLLPVTIVPESFGLAAIAVALSLLALLLPAGIIAARQVMTVRRAESRPGRSFVQRYFLDLALAAAAALLLLELRQRGSVFTPSSTGGVSSDPLLLASPALAIAGAAVLILRFYPLVLRLVERAGRRIWGAWVALGLAQAIRNSGQYTRLALLLMMAVAVGTFAASYSASANRSYEDRANYEAGADLRASRTANAIIPGLDPAPLEQAADKLPGVSASSAVVRTSASLAVAGQSSADFQVLGIRPAAVDLLHFRGDYSDRQPDDLVAPLGGFDASLIGRKLPGNPAEVGVWVRADDQVPAVTVYASLRDANGASYTIPIGDVQGDIHDWQYVSGPVDAHFLKPVAPLTLLAISFSAASFQRSIPPVLLDDVTVSDASGAKTVVESFDGSGSWTAFPQKANTQDGVELVGGAHGGTRALRYTFGPDSSSAIRGFYLADLFAPAPAVVSDSFVAATGVGVGGVAVLDLGSDAYMPIRVAGTFHLFPTTATADGPVVLLDRDQLLAWTGMVLRGLGRPLAANELWMSLGKGADQQALEETLRTPKFAFETTTSRAASLAAIGANPLIAASGSGILSVAFAAVLLLVGAAMLVSLVNTTRRRQVEFAVVRAIGLSPGQIVRMLALEYATVFVVGVAAGAALGLFVSNEMLSFLDVTEAGEHVEPSFVLVTRWPVVAAGIGVIALVFAGALLAFGRAASRIPATRALRGD